MIFTLAAKELRSLFLSPLAWVILALMQFILIQFYASAVEQYLQLQPRLAAMGNDPGMTAVAGGQIYSITSFVVMLIIPLMTMKVISEEKRSATLPLLLSAPINNTEIVLGKFLGLLGFNATLVVLITLMPLSLLFGGSIDYGMLGAMIIGLFLLMACYTALGLFMSSLTNSPILAAVMTYLVILFLYILDLIATQDNPTGLFDYISLRVHLENFFQGLFSTEDVVYYLLFIVTFIVLSIRKLDAERLHA